MYQATAYVYPTEKAGYGENGQRETVPGKADLVLAYPAPGTKYGERTFTFAGHAPKTVRRMLALLKHGPRSVVVGNEMAADMMR